MRLRFSPLLAAALLAPAPLAAQVLNRPERAADVVERTTDTSHSSQSLTVSLNVMGGYDRNDTESFVGGPDLPVLFESSSSGTVDGGLAYSRSQGTRTLGLAFNGTGTFYSGDLIQAGPARAFNGGLTFSTPMGRAARFSFEERLMYDSLYSLGAFDDIGLEQPIGELPVGGPTQGVAEIGSISSDSNVGLQYNLGRRSALSGSYGYVRRVYSGISTGDLSSQRATVALSRQLRRTTGMNVSYGYSSGDYAPLVGGGGTRPLVGHFVQGGFNVTKRLSPRRAVQFSFGVGATRADAVTGDDDINYTFWAPSANMQARVDLVRTWALSTNYSRGTTALSGLTREAYSSDAFGLSVGGQVGRVDLVFTTGAARGATGAGAAVTSDYMTYTTAVQLGVPITKRLSGVVQYSLYSYEVSGNAELPSALPSSFSRSAIRAGLSVRLPIIEPRAAR
jgi:hypothetical protein